MKTKRDAERDYVKANRKGNRDTEIGMYGRPLAHHKVHQSQKSYNRKKEKAAFKKLPFPLPSRSVIIPSCRPTRLSVPIP